MPNKEEIRNIIDYPINNISNGNYTIQSSDVIICCRLWSSAHVIVFPSSTWNGREITIIWGSTSEVFGNFINFDGGEVVDLFGTDITGQALPSATYKFNVDYWQKISSSS